MINEPLNIPSVADDQLLSLDQMKTALAELDSLVLDALSFDEIKKVFFEKLKMLPQLIRLGNTFGLPLYRVTVNDRLNFDVTNPNTFSYPSSEHCQIGRCNRKGHPVFYASASEHTALCEKRRSGNTRLEPGDEVYISTWKVDEHCPFHYSQFIFKPTVGVGEVISLLNTDNLLKVKEIAKAYSTDKQAAFEYMLHKFGDYFLSENYNLSSFLCHNLLYDGRGRAPIVADAILYPSVQKYLNDYNIAIHPDFMAAHVRLTEVRKVRLTNVTDTGAQLQLIESGVLTEFGKIEWVSSAFGTKNMHLTIIGISFKDEEPASQEYSNECGFMYGSENRSLESICWNYLKQNQTKVLTILSKNINKQNKKQRKELFVYTPGDIVAVEVDGLKYTINAIKTEIEYEILCG